MVTLGEIAQTITALAAAAAVALTWRNSRKIEQVHKATNSMKDELVTEVRNASLAEGIKQGRAERGDS